MLPSIKFCVFFLFAFASGSVLAEECDPEMIGFELVTGYVFSAPLDVMDSLPGTLMLTDCLESCQTNESCQAVNYETGLCVLFSSSADIYPGKYFQNNSYGTVSTRWLWLQQRLKQRLIASHCFSSGINSVHEFTCKYFLKPKESSLVLYLFENYNYSNFRGFQTQIWL